MNGIHKRKPGNPTALHDASELFPAFRWQLQPNEGGRIEAPSLPRVQAFPKIVTDTQRNAGEEVR